MSSLAGVPNQDFDRIVTSVDLDKRFLLIGKLDGSLSAVYIKNGLQVFSVKISEEKITAVCCEKHNEDEHQVFYAGDISGYLFVLNKKGKILNKPKLSMGRITAIVNWSQFCIQVHTDKGTASFSHTDKEFKREDVSTVSSTYSYDNDGTMFKNADTGRFKVTRYQCGSPATVIATIGIEFGEIVNSFSEVFAYTVIDEDYKELIDDGTAQHTLTIYSKNIFRIVEFKSAVKQVMSCRHHEGDAEDDHIYILLWNGTLLKVIRKQIFTT